MATDRDFSALQPQDAASVPTEGHDAAVLAEQIAIAFLAGATAGILATVSDDTSEVMSARVEAEAREYGKATAERLGGYRAAMNPNTPGEA